MLAGANVITIVAMAMAGYSGWITPETAPRLACMGLAFPLFLGINAAFLVFWLLVRLRYALIPLGGCLLCFSPLRTYCPLNLPLSAPEGSLTVLSYNVWYFGSNNEDGTNNIMDYIARSGADIVTLQEAYVSGRQAGMFDSIMAAHYPYRDSVVYNKTGSLTLLSRYPILGKERIDYASENNCSAVFTLDIDGEETAVINNHLESTGLTPEDRERYRTLMHGDLEADSARQEGALILDKLALSTRRRAAQARTVARSIRKNAWRSVICTGDFNDSPLSYARRTIGEGLTDCYRASACGPGISYHRSGFWVRIDNIFCSRDWRPYECRVDRSIADSDHYPIRCKLKKVRGKQEK